MQAQNRTAAESDPDGAMGVSTPAWMRVFLGGSMRNASQQRGHFPR
jgi:hypothetical protein